MGSIYKRGQTYTAQFVVDGRRRQVALGTSSKRRALAALSKLEEAQQRGLWDPLSQTPAAILAPTSNETVHSRPRSLELQIEAFLRSRSNLRPRSQETYREVLVLYLREGTDLRRFLTRRHGVTKYKYYRHLHVFYNWQVRQGWIPKNPCEDVALPRKPHKEAVFFSREQIEALLGYLRAEAGTRETRYLPQMIEFVCYTGLRLTEVCTLAWKDVGEDQLVLRKTKSGCEERVLLVPRAKEILDALERRGDQVFACPPS